MPDSADRQRITPGAWLQQFRSREGRNVSGSGIDEEGSRQPSAAGGDSPLEMVGGSARATVRPMPNHPLAQPLFQAPQSNCRTLTPVRTRIVRIRTARIRRPARKLGHSLLCVVLMSLGLACDRNIEAFEPGEEPSAPDLARIFPAPAGGVGGAEAAGSAETANSGSGQAARAALPPSRAEAGSPASSGSANASVAPIEGVIEIAPEHASSRPDGAILFVIARNVGARGGPPLAVLRIAEPSFPLAFTIGPENVMIPSMKFAGSISLSARLDADGNAMTRGAGDVSSATQEPLTPGMTGVTLLLSEKS
jgi:hypothetical protein